MLQYANNIEDVMRIFMSFFFKSGFMYSGVFSSSVANTYIPGKGDIGFCIETSTGGPTRNTFFAGDLVGILDGRVIKVTDYHSAETFYDSNKLRNIITLSDPPSNSGDSRYDLVFVEFYETLKEEGWNVFRNNNVSDTVERVATTYEKIQEWHLRIYSGVDYDNYSDGVTDPAVKAIGAAGANTVYTFGVSATDSNVFIAGTGSSEAKSALVTIDGYSRCVPLFVVERRNSAPYNASTNANGAPKYASTTLLAPVSSTDTTLSLTSTTGMRAGYKLKIGTSKIVTISTVDSSTAVTLTGQVGSNFSGGTAVITYSDRSDGKYSDVIYSSDVIFLDLGCKISDLVNEFESYVEAPVLVSNTTSGAPLVVSSGTKVVNLNADKIDGIEGVDLVIGGMRISVRPENDPPSNPNTNDIWICTETTVE